MYALVDYWFNLLPALQLIKPLVTNIILHTDEMLLETPNRSSTQPATNILQWLFVILGMDRHAKFHITVRFR